MRDLVASYAEDMLFFFGLDADFTTGPGFLQAEMISFLVPPFTTAS